MRGLFYGQAKCFARNMSRNTVHAAFWHTPVPPTHCMLVQVLPYLHGIASMTNMLASVWALLVGIVLIMLGNGMHFTLMGLRGGIEGFS